MHDDDPAAAGLRVDELAARAGTTVDTVRYYQGRGLLPPPERRGRIALYGEGHVQRLARIRSLRAQGLSLATIGRLLRGELRAEDEPLLAAVAGATGGGGMSMAQLAERTRIPLGILRAAEREGLLPHPAAGYDQADADAALAGIRLLELGLPLPELLSLARRHADHVRSLAEDAVALFDAHVRQPLHEGGHDPDEAAARLVEAFHAVLPATVAVVARHLERTLLAVATEHIEHIEHVGRPAEATA